MSSIDVSVVFAVKNEQVYVESAIQSVLDQVGLAHEVIVVDDGSTDDTHLIISRLEVIHTRLRVYSNPGVGKCSAFNFGVSHSRGTFVCIFAGDDIMPPGTLSARWSTVKDLPSDIPGIGLCKLVTMSEIKRFNGHLIPRAPGRGALSGVSPLMNRKALEKIFPVPEILPNEDTWMELATLHLPGWNVIHSDIIGCFWRVHTGNSINMLIGFDEYNRRITARMRAFSLFYEKYSYELGEESRRELCNKVICEERRSSGSLIGVLCSPVNIVDKLRALSITNSFMYEIRRKLYGLLSGW